jgi:hypothetical protein
LLVTGVEIYLPNSKSFLLICIYIFCSIGSLGRYNNELDVSGITVSKCTLKSTMYGVRIKTWAGSDPSQASDITFEDISMENVNNPIIIDQNYGSGSGEVIHTHIYIYTHRHT